VAMSIRVDPQALDSTSGTMVAIGHHIGSVQATLSGHVTEAGHAVGDPVLRGAIEAFHSRVNGGVDSLGQAVAQLGQALEMAAEAYRTADASAIPSGGGR